MILKEPNSNFKKFEEEMKKKIKNEVKVCPKCNSQDISLSDLEKWRQRAGLFIHKCNNCGYEGTMTLMEKKDADKLKILKSKKSD